jgi:dienelactone hydrolase
MNQTASLDPNLLGLDGKAWLAGLEQENASSSSFLSGAVDMQRIAILGHSVGGANVFRVLAEEPRYRVGACFAPMITPPNYALQVRQPLAVIVGEGDLVTPPATHARPNWDLVQPYSGVKLYYLLDPTANHLNVALGAEPGGTVIDRAIFERCSDVALSFVDHYLTGDSHAFDRCVGSEARSEIHSNNSSTSAPIPFSSKEAPRSSGKLMRS